MRIADKINAGIAVAVARIEERGWEGDTCMITPDAAGSAMLEEALKGAAYDCVVIGGGPKTPLTLPPARSRLADTQRQPLALVLHRTDHTPPRVV